MPNIISMTTFSETTPAGLFAVDCAGGLGAPIVLIWGWVRWIRQTKLRTVASVLSLIGFIASTASALLAVWAAANAWLIHINSSHAYYDDRFLYAVVGWLLSLSGVAFGICGLWRPSALRWHAPLSAVCLVAFWMVGLSSGWFGEVSVGS